MSNETSSTVTPSADPAPAAPVSVTDTLVAQLRAMRALVPEYTQLPVPEKKAIVVVAKATDPDFVQSAINSIGASSNVQQAVGSTPEQVRQDTIDALSWTAVEEEARSFLNGIVGANLVRRYRIGKTALAAYSIATRLVQQQPDHSDLLPHVETMKRLNRFGKKRAKPAASAPAPTTTPPAAAAQPVTAPVSPKPE